MSVKDYIKAKTTWIAEKGAIEANRLDLKFVPKTGLDLAIHLTEHCNLNCQNCDTYAPLAKSAEQDLDELEKDLKYLSEFMGPDRIHTLHLSGGEPLMHTRIDEIPSLVRRYLPRTYIYFITNGTLIPKMTERFFEECHKNYVNLEVTRYPIKFDYDKAFSIVASHNVQIVNYNTREQIKTSWHFPLNFDGSGVPVYNFSKCVRANYCHVLFEHRLYTCSAIPRIRIFNEYFNTNIPISDLDGIDIYKVKSPEEILEFLAKPVPFCRFCYQDKYTFGHQWGITKKDLKEWSCDTAEDLKNKLYSSNITEKK